MTGTDHNIKSSNICKHYRTAINPVVSDLVPPAERKLEVQDKLICLDCGEEVEFSPTIFVPDIFIVSLRHYGK
jgi:hypothetical protein